MPIYVDVQERLDELAVATLAVIQRESLAAVTIRSVAREVGRSTAVVTNFLPTRAALVLNAFRHGRKEWDRELAEATDGLDGPERLERALEWWTSSGPLDDALRQLWLEILVTAGTDEEFAALASDLGREDHARAEQLVRAAVADADDQAVDILLLVLRGFWVAALESPDEWNPERGLLAVQAVLSALLADRSVFGSAEG